MSELLVVLEVLFHVGVFLFISCPILILMWLGKRSADEKVKPGYRPKEYHGGRR